MDAGPHEGAPALPARVAAQDQGLQEPDPVAVVAAFNAAWQTDDAEAVLAFRAEDALVR